MDTFLTLNNLQLLFKQHRIQPKKTLGQNFLIDRNIRNKILSFIEITTDDIIIEIGAGTGALTGLLSEKAALVYAFEKDEKLVEILQEQTSGLSTINIIKGDFLEIDEGFFRTIGKKIKIIGNLPYYVASPILFKLLDMRYYWNTALVMIPEDVALKIVAKTGDKNFGFMGFVFSLLTQSTICYKIKGSAFYPEPEITSVLMKISIPDKPLMEIKNQQLFWSIAPKLFVQRRKTILNVMKNSFHINRETAIEILQKAGIQPQLRSHQIEIPYLIELIKQISKQI